MEGAATEMTTQAMDDITLTDLISLTTLQKIQDAFANATGMAALTVDLNGAVTQLSNPTDFCMKLTRGCPKGAERCNQCDLKGGEEAGRTGRPSVYYCHGGLMDFAAPILLGKKQIGSLIGGQVLPELPDVEKFRRIAREIGVDETAYISALSKIKIMPKKTIESCAQLLYVMANALSEMGYQRYQTHNLVRELDQFSTEMSVEVQKAAESIGTVETRNSALVEQVNRLFVATKESHTEVEKTGQIVKYMNNISMQTKLLGFNASVEASRAREFGAGFGVIAQEIRKLAETSQDQFAQVEDIIGKVKGTIINIDGGIEQVSTAVSANTELLVAAAALIRQISCYAQKLDELGRQL